ncbi:MAG: hypothetical protein V4538_12040 [Bacteroidota bacterium]
MEKRIKQKIKQLGITALKVYGLIITCFLLLSLFQNCSSNKEATPNEDFIRKYGTDNYDVFKNKSFSVRGFDEGNPIVFIRDYAATQQPCGLVSMTISSQTKELLAVKEVPQKDSCVLSFDKAAYYNLAIAFLKYDINYLSVDSDLNVFIKTLFVETPPDLVQFASPKNIADTKFVQIKDNWYSVKQ